MQVTGWHYETQRVGEIVVVGPPGSSKQPFLSSLCPEVTITDQDIIFGRMPVSDDLILYCYGIGYSPNHLDFAWDLVATKMLGCIILFDWKDERSFELCKRILDFITARYNAPIIVAADLGDKPFPVPEYVFKPNITLSSKVRFTFCKSSKASSVQKVVASLFDLLLELTA